MDRAGWIPSVASSFLRPCPARFFLWGYIKDRVYVDPPTTPQDLEDRILNACRTVTPFMLRRVKENIVERLNMCIRKGGIYLNIYYEIGEKQVNEK